MMNNIDNLNFIFTIFICIYVENVICENDVNFTPKLWDGDVYTGRQLNTLALHSTSIDNVVFNPVLMFMYAPLCHGAAKELRSALTPWGPLSKYLTIVMYDYVTTPRHIWYKLDDVDDLNKRYLGTEHDCLKVVFLRKAKRLDEPELFNFEGNIYDWVWAMMVIPVNVLNTISSKVNVMIEGQGDPRLLFDLDPYELKQAHVHISMFITVYDNSGSVLLYYHKIEPWTIYDTVKINEETLDKFRRSRSAEPGWIHRSRLQAEEESKHRDEKTWNIAHNYLLTFKQPVILPRFTETGYKLSNIPTSVYDLLKNFYVTNRNSSVVESQYTGYTLDPIVNDIEIPTTLVPLAEDVKTKLFVELRKVMEDWCKCDLEQTFFWGIREYHHGSVLLNHVDRIETHVISAILQVHQELAGNWALEIIDFHGERKQVALKPGEMLLYESATLIHGRPSPFQGELFANCFIHYKPVKDWKWKKVMAGNLPVLTNNDVTELVSAINTPATLNKDYCKSNECENS